MRWLAPLALLLAATSSLDAQSPYQGTIDTWVQQDAADPPPKDGLVVVGSSSVRLWERLSYDFRAWDVVQRGFGGSQFSDLNQFVDELVLAHEPACVAVFEGTNDVASGKSAAEVFGDYRDFVDLVRAGDPPGEPVPIVYIGITPTPARWSLWPVASQVNAMVEAHAAGDPTLFYADVPSAFLATGSPPDPGLFLSDQLHLNQAGYDLWTQVIRPVVALASPSTRTYRPNHAHPRTGSSLFLDLGPADAPNAAPTTSPDANGNHWSNWFWIATGTHVLAGEHRGDLETSDGIGSGIGLVVTGELDGSGLGGLTSPSPAQLGELAVESATRDFFFCDDAYTPGGLLLTGLDPWRRYDLSLFAGRRIAGSQVTRFVVTGRRSHTGTLEVAGNTHTVLLLDALRPDECGRLWIDLEVVSGRAYLGVLRLDVGPHVGKGHKVRQR